MLESLHIDTVDVAIRQRKASGLIIANFMVRNVEQNAQALHAAKSAIQQAVDAVYARLPDNVCLGVAGVSKSVTDLFLLRSQDLIPRCSIGRNS